MAWCPKCKSEYVDGITVCADCGCELVDSLEEDELQEEEETETVCLEEPEGEEKKRYSVYQNHEERAAENRSSAYTLLTVGCVGLVLIILLFFDVISIRMSVSGKYMVTGVMGVLFLLFIVMGAVSMKNSKLLKRKAAKENNLTQEIKKWCRENFSAEKIDGQLDLQEQQEELKYFQRYDFMRNKIQNQFVNLDEGYLGRLVEEVYSEIFEEEA